MSNFFYLPFFCDIIIICFQIILCRLQFQKIQMGCVQGTNAISHQNRKKPNQHQRGNRSHSHNRPIQVQKKAKKHKPTIKNQQKSQGMNRRKKQMEEMIQYEKFTEFPPQCYCPLTQGLFEDPVLTVDGHTYEREIIQAWFRKGKTTSPLTNLQLSSKILIPNIALRTMINNLKERVKESYQNVKKREIKEVVQQLYIESKIRQSKKEKPLKQSNKQLMGQEDILRQEIMMQNIAKCLMCEKQIKQTSRFVQQCGMCRPCYKKQKNLQQEIMGNQNDEELNLITRFKHIFQQPPYELGQIQKFWAEYDEQQLSLWKLDYNMNQLKQKKNVEFMVCNFMKEIIRSFTKVRTNVFGVIGVYKGKGSFQISGVMLLKRSAIVSVFEEEKLLKQFKARQLNPSHSHEDRLLAEQYWKNQKRQSGLVQGRAIIKTGLIK